MTEQAGLVAVRGMEPDDAQAVADLVAQLGYQRTAEQVRGWVARLAMEGLGQAAFVACHAGTVVGWIEVSVVRHVQSAEHAQIGGLVVKEGVRGLGIGRLLCAQAESWVRDQGLGEIVVTSRSTRSAAHRFYLRDGYERVKTSEVFRKQLIAGG